MKPDTKQCAHCHRVLHVSLFCKNKTREDGLNERCRKCHGAQVKRSKLGLARAFLAEQGAAAREARHRVEDMNNEQHDPLFK